MVRTHTKPAPTDLNKRRGLYLGFQTTCDAFIRGLVYANWEQGEYDTADDYLFSFEHKGKTVRNPFWSRHGEDCAVEPLAYYGDAFIMSSFVTKALEALVNYPDQMDVLVHADEDVELDDVADEDDDTDALYERRPSLVFTGPVTFKMG